MFLPWLEPLDRASNSAGNMIFSIAVSDGTRWKDWNTNPDRLVAKKGKFIFRFIRDIFGFHPYATIGGLVETGEQAQQGGLTTPAAAHDGDGLAGFDLQGDVLEYIYLPFADFVSLGKVLCFEKDHYGFLFSGF